MSAPTAPRTALGPGDVVVRAVDLPAPGDVVVLTLAPGLVAVVENTAPVEAPVAVDSVAYYVPVEVNGARVVHAAAVWQRAVRTRVDAGSLCSRGGTRRVTRRLDAVPLDAVTCRQCRGHLTRAGVLADPTVLTD